MVTELTYAHGRNIFIKNEFKPFVYKWFKDYKFCGFGYGWYDPTISISNWDDVKNELPKSYQPIYVNGELNKLNPKYNEYLENEKN